jgi:hypothetical protein
MNLCGRKPRSTTHPTTKFSADSRATREFNGLKSFAVAPGFGVDLANGQRLKAKGLEAFALR